MFSSIKASTDNYSVKPQSRRFHGRKKLGRNLEFTPLSPLLMLPTELLLVIMEFLDIVSLISISRVSTLFRSVSAGMRSRIHHIQAGDPKPLAVRSDIEILYYHSPHDTVLLSPDDSEPERLDFEQLAYFHNLRELTTRDCSRLVTWSNLDTLVRLPCAKTLRTMSLIMDHSSEANLLDNSDVCCDLFSLRLVG